MSNRRIEKSQNFDFNSWCQTQIKKKKALLSSRIFVVVLFWAILITYLISPLSKAGIVTYEGNHCVIDEKDVYKIGEFDNKTFWWNINVKDVEDKLLAYGDGKYILDADISYSITGLKVILEENIIVGKFKNASDNYVYVLRDGSIFVDDSSLETSQHYYDKKHLAATQDIPYIQYEIIESNSKKDVTESLARFELIGKLSSIEKAPSLSNGSLDQYKLVFAKEKTGLEHDLEIIINIDDLVDVLCDKNYPLITALVTDNVDYLIDGKYKIIYGPVSGGDNAYGFLPYIINE